MTRLTPHQQLQLMVVTLVTPLVAVVAWTVGLRLAGGVLAAVWVAVGAMYVRSTFTADDGPRSVPAAPQTPAPATGAPAAVDPAAALLEALGDALTGRAS